MGTKEELHALVDRLPDGEIEAAKEYIERLMTGERRPTLEEALAAAPTDDEPLTDEDRAALEEARNDLAAGRTLTSEEIRRKYSV